MCPTPPKTKVIAFFMFIAFFMLGLGTAFSQTNGDYRSTGTGDWELTSTWETYNGTTWVAATSYPGQNSGTYMVTIQAGHTVSVTSNMITATMGEVEVFGVLNLVGGSSPRTVTLNTQLLDIASGGGLNFNTQKVDLYLPTNSVLEIQSGGNITGACSNNTEIFIGGQLIAVCVGGGGSVATFGEIVASGGTLNANIVNPTNNQQACLNDAIALNGSYSGTPVSAVTYDWTVQDPSGAFTYYNTQNVSSYTLNQIGNYLFSLTVSTTVSGSTFSNTETHIVTVSPTAVGGTASSDQLICNGSSPANLTLSGQTGAIQWQSSTDNVTFGDISGATSTTLTSAQMGTLTTTTYYRAAVTSGSCVVAYSNMITITVSSPLVTTSVTICQGDSSASLSSSTCSAGVSSSSSNFAGAGSTSGSGDNWSSTGNIYSDDGLYASETGRGDSNNLDATNFGFAIPSNATIDGVEVKINRYSASTSGNGTRDVQVQMLKNGSAFGDNKAITGSAWSTNTNTVVTYGGASDGWTASLTPSDVNALNFGVTLKINNNQNSNDAYLDYIQIVVYYTVSGISWYTTSTGGTAIGYGLSFNPVGVSGSGLIDTNTSGTYTYYAECSSNPCSRTATTFTINTIPTVATTTPGNRYGAGTVILGATASSGGTLSWYDASTGGSLLGTGTSFTTPSISTTTTYYVECTKSSCTSSRTAVVATVYEPDINITGNGTTILSGDITPLIADNTDFGAINLGTSVTKTYSIQNLGNGTLNLTGTPIVSGVGSSSFSITQPTANSIASGGADLTFSVTYTPTVVGTAQFDISIANDDSTGGENPYTFRIAANAQQNFFDSDGDGVYDNVDIDDDNDGIKDSDEELNCRKSSVASVANYKYLDETFGTLPPGSRTTINTTYNATTSYCYEPGTGSGSSCGTSWILDDGEYVVVSKIAGTTASDPDNIHGDLAWTNVLDHTPGDGDSGGMAVFNAAWDPGVFYETTITGVLPNVPISYSFWVLNIMAQSKYSGSILPNVTVQFLDTSGNIISSINTGQFGRCSTDVTDNSCTDNVWLNFSSNDINIGNRNEFIVKFINNAPGGGGNDLALDDIIISQTLCDTDSDGVADIFDLDSDNDGIPDVVESNSYNASISNGNGVIKGASFVDANGNGMNDASENIAPVDTDGDGVPNYIDLDSDNDGIFDVDESGVVSTSAPAGTENGDGDINGDGAGDGSDTDAYRETDTNSDGIIEYFTDGILDKYDYFDGTTFAGSYGNISQGTAPYYAKDTDNDGIPDYMDVKSDGTNFDISKTLYSNTNQTLAGLPVLDANNDGIIDNATDTDGDGIPDVFDTDNTKFGSPRDLNRKLELYFDGRNDYAEDSPSVLSGLGNATLMGWIKIDPLASGDEILFGQNNFYLELLSNKKVIVKAGAQTVTSLTTLATNQWIHVAATYSSNNSLLTLYINGVNEGTIAVSGALSSDTSHFTIGRMPDTDSNYYHGYFDEVRAFNTDLTADELHKMIYQEIEDNAGNVHGSVIPRDVTNYVNTTTTPVALPWANLTRYFRMDVYKDDIIDDLTTPTTDIGTGAKIYNMKIIDPQTAPLPFLTKTSDTTLPNAVDNPTTGIKGTDVTSYDWSIVKIQHKNITYNANQKHLGLFVDKLDASSNPIEFSIQNNTELNVSWYLKLDGFIDLEGESQLVQGDDSMLDQNSGGYIERDQQGTANSFNYNYWASSVGPITIEGSPSGIESTNSANTIGNFLEDGTNANSPLTINFGTSYAFADTGVTSPIRISSYWLYKFNGTDDDYNSWVSIDQNSSILAGEGYTMKGTSGSVPIATQQNYVFKGKPYNGDFTLPIVAGNDRLIGNPYPSAMDADEFILDNISTANGGRNTSGNIFNGAIYYWDHFGQINTHILKEYVGGYATYTLMGGAKAYANDSRINATGGSGTKIPKRYIPVNQGFFVIAINDTLTNSLQTPTVISGGNIVFKNSQRAFETESLGNSLFLKSASKKETTSQKATEIEDIRPKIWLEYTSPEGYHRQLLVGVDENTSNDFDIGYDGPMADLNNEDMYWNVDGGKFVIQAVNNFDKTQKLPFGLKLAEDGLATIKIDSLANIDNTIKLYVKDNLTGETYKINKKPFEINLTAGDYNNRFSIVFQPRLKTPDEISLKEGFNAFSNNNSEIVVNKIIDTKILSIRVSNALGQTLLVRTKNLEDRDITIPIKETTGVYFVQISTSNGIINKKVFLE